MLVRRRASESLLERGSGDQHDSRLLIEFRGAQHLPLPPRRSTCGDGIALPRRCVAEPILLGAMRAIECRQQRRTLTCFDDPDQLLPGVEHGIGLVDRSDHAGLRHRQFGGEQAAPARPRD